MVLNFRYETENSYIALSKKQHNTVPQLATREKLNK
jgi:hypothetical protein